MLSVAQLDAILPKERYWLSTGGEAGFAPYGTDRTGLVPRHSYVAFPTSTEEVARLVAACYQTKTPVVASGGRTGYAGGCTAHIQGSLVISFDKMNRIASTEAARSAAPPVLTCQAGVVLADVQAEAKTRGWYYPVDMASAGSAQIGGTVATNAGGLHVIRYGGTRHWVLGLTVVDGTGTIRRIGREVLKDNSGFDLKQLLIGSEGTLGLITEVQLRLTSPPGPTGVLLAALGNAADLPAAFQMIAASADLLAFEFFDANSMQSVRAHLDLRPPFRDEYPFYILAEWFEKEPAENLAAGWLESGLLGDAVVAAGDTDVRALWRYREGISESLSRHKELYKNDVSLPLHRIPGFLTETRERLNGLGLECALFGHFGDGNIHVNFFPKKHDDAQATGGTGATPIQADWTSLSRTAADWIYQTVAECGGSGSAEHGIGLLKKDYMHYMHSPGELAMMKGIKALWDPAGILNPGKVL